MVSSRITFAESPNSSEFVVLQSEYRTLLTNLVVDNPLAHHSQYSVIPKLLFAALIFPEALHTTGLTMRHLGAFFYIIFTPSSRFVGVDLRVSIFRCAAV